MQAPTFCAAQPRAVGAPGLDSKTGTKRTVGWLLMVALSVPVATASGCSSSSSGAMPDGGGVTDGASEACSITATLTTYAFPDASLPGDASINQCLTCGAMTCAMPFAACDRDCACKMAFVSFFACVAGGQGYIACDSSITSSDTAVALGECMLSGCTEQCGAGALADAGAADAGTDAPSSPDAGRD
jgi:hypothetical protein